MEFNELYKDENNHKNIGRFVMKTRFSNTLSQTDLAHKCNITTNQLIKIESGIPVNYDIIEKVLHTMNLNFNDFILFKQKYNLK